MNAIKLFVIFFVASGSMLSVVHSMPMSKNVFHIRSPFGAKYDLKIVALIGVGYHNKTLHLDEDMTKVSVSPVEVDVESTITSEATMASDVSSTKEVTDSPATEEGTEVASVSGEPNESSASSEVTNETKVSEASTKEPVSFNPLASQASAKTP